MCDRASVDSEWIEIIAQENPIVRRRITMRVQALAADRLPIGKQPCNGQTVEPEWVRALRERLAHLDSVGDTVVLLKTSELRALLLPSGPRTEEPTDGP